jgi:hypothetical protein
MSSNEFNQPISYDFAPHGSVCEWCGKPAEQQITVIGGKFHNDEGFYCLKCGKDYVREVTDALNANAAAETKTNPPTN